MTSSDQIGDIAAALAKAQGAMKNAHLNKTNPHFRSKYADLAGIRDAVTPALSANGIAVVQVVQSEVVEGVARVSVVTRLVHASGQWFESALPIPTGKMQEMGSAITYARRYALSAICGIAADEDDDGTVANAIPAFDEAGYRAWLENLETSARVSSYPELVEVVKAGPDAFQSALRADKKRWTAIKALTQDTAVPA